MRSLIITVIPRAGKGKDNEVIVGLEDGLYFWNLNSGESKFLDNPETSKPGNRFNDCKCDPMWVFPQELFLNIHGIFRGRLFAGTMEDAETGQVCTPLRNPNFLLNLPGDRWSVRLKPSKSQSSHCDPWEWHVKRYGMEPWPYKVLLEWYPQTDGLWIWLRPSFWRDHKQKRTHQNWGGKARRTQHRFPGWASFFPNYLEIHYVFLLLNCAATAFVHAASRRQKIVSAALQWKKDRAKINFSYNIIVVHRNWNLHRQVSISSLN